MLGFDRTAGDEMQALVADGEALRTVLRESIADGRWSVGVGIGPVEHPLPASVREGRGPAYWAARTALTKAKARRQGRPVAVRSAEGYGSSSDETASFSLERCLGVLAFIINRRTPKQRKAADVSYAAGYSVRSVIEQLGLSPQGAHQILNAAGIPEEKELLELAVELARPVVAP
jgi:hypothetical protein